MYKRLLGGERFAIISGTIDFFLVTNSMFRYEGVVFVSVLKTTYRHCGCNNKELY